MPDAVADTGRTDTDAGFEILPPNIDWLDAGAPQIAPPSLTPCPPGWHEMAGSEDGDPVTCEPYPDGGPAECRDGWAHFIGEPGCTPVGASCPVGDFPEGLPSDQPVLYVLAGASAGGDGSQGAPLTTIAEAMALTSPGTVVALGKGVYDEVVYLAAGVTLWGACAPETRLTVSSPIPSARGVVQAFAADSRLQSVRIGPAEIPGLAAHGPTAHLTVTGVLIEGVRSAGLTVTDSARVDGRTLCVSSTRADSSGGAGYGVLARSESTVELTRALLSRNHNLGLFVVDAGTSVTLTDLVVRDTQSQESGRAFGRGLSVQEGATADVTRALFERNRDIGVFVASVGTVVTLTDLVVRDTQSRESDGTSGRGLSVQLGATADVTRALFERNRDIGVFVGSVDTSATLTDLVVRDTQSRESDRAFGGGLRVELGATAEVTRAFFERNREVSTSASGVGTSLTFTDLVVRGTQGRESDRALGRGFGVQQGATAEVTRALFERNRSLCVSVADVDTSLTVTDLVIRDTQSRESDRAFGRGLNVQDGATANVTRTLMERNRDASVFVSDVGTSLTLTDLVIRDTQSRESDTGGGRGLNVQDGATADVTRARFARNHEFGALAAGAGATARLTDLVVEETAEQSCAMTTCPERPFGVGLASVVSATMAATRFALTDSALCGVFLADHGELDLSAGEVSGSPVGVCLQVADYPVARLTAGVRYVGNGANLDATTLPLPEVSQTVDPGP